MIFRRHSRQSKKFVSRRRLRFASVSLLSIIVVGGLVWLTSYFFSLPQFMISNVLIHGIDEDYASDIRVNVFNTLDGNFFGIIPRANSFIFSRSSIRSVIRENRPEIASVSVAREGLKTILVEIVERQPDSLVCTSYPDFDGGNLALNDPGTCYFADHNGLIFKKAPSFSGKLYKRYYVPQLAQGTSTLLGTVGKQVSDNFASLKRFYDGVAEEGFVVDGMLINDNSDYELYVRDTEKPNQSSGTTVIHFGGKASLDEQLSNLLSFWKHAKSQKPIPSFSDIKLNYPPNIYYTENQ